jgi:hypothetical protein
LHIAEQFSPCVAYVRLRGTDSSPNASATIVRYTLSACTQLQKVIDSLSIEVRSGHSPQF